MSENLSSPNQFPCSNCGFFRGQGGIACKKCGHDPNVNIPPPIANNRNDSDYSGMDGYNLIGRPIMKFIGYPIGYVTLKLFSFGSLKFGPWNNNGAKYDISLSNVLSFRKSDDENNYRLRTETVAVIGWNVLCLVAFTVAFFTLRGN